MAALRTWRGSAVSSTPFWLTALCAALAPTSIGYQDFAALVARQPGLSERSRDHLIASPFGTIHAATFDFSRPIGTGVPESLIAQPVNFEPSSPDVKIWSANEAPTRPAVEVAYPTVNRRLKGDRLPLPQARPPAGEPDSAPQLQPIDAPVPPPAPSPPPATPPRLKTTDRHDAVPTAAEADAVIEAALLAAEARDDMTAAATAAEATDPAISPSVSPATSATPDSAPLSFAAVVKVTAAPLPDLVAPAPERETTGTIPAAPAASLDGAAARSSDVEEDAAIADKPPEIPVVRESDALAAVPSPFASLSFLDEDPAERSAQLYFGAGAMGSRDELRQWAPGSEPVLVAPAIDRGIKLAALEGRDDTGTGGETLASKNDPSRSESPADRLGLKGRPRAKAEKCLADAVYFEARGEPLRGQMAVAQVVMNRVFSGYYPNDVCGVVYQNANHYLACQFTFACDGIRDVVNEPEMWTQAKRIAKDTLDGKIWLAEVGHATHYHAYWVHPSWVHEMKKMYKLGVHTFYRPRAWGDGANAPIWGTAPMTPRPEAAKGPAGAGTEPVAKL